MSDCIFCKIARKDIPSNVVYDDDDFLGILDVNPVSKGHTLVIPKSHYENIFDIPEEELSRMSKVISTLAKRLRDSLNADGVNIVNASGKEAQQSVFHLHFHIIPRFKDDGLDLWFHGRSKFSDEEMKKFAEMIRENVRC